jgi:glucoamylase
MVRWSFDHWQTSHDGNSEDSGWNLQHLDLPTETLVVGRQIVFTFFWKNSGQWEGRDFVVTVE